MAKPSSPLPAKLIVGMISGFDDAFQLAESRLSEIYGPIDSRSDIFLFDMTSYYESEMGADLKRIFLSFASPIAPDRIADIKLQTNELELEIARSRDWGVSRPINLDPGYVTSSKLVLATTKDFSHRIHLAEGIYAEVTLRFRKGCFEPWPWTYPDYKTEGYIAWFTEVRKLYLAGLKRDQPEA